MTKATVTPLNPDPERGRWLVNTLYALRGHFDKEGETNTTPKDLRSLPSGKEGIVFRCADGRIDEMTDLGLERGQYYEGVSFGAAVPPAGGGENLAMAAALRRALLKNDAPDKPTPPRACIFMGHENCGANATLLDAVLDPAAPSAKPEETALMQPMASGAFSDALRHAKNADHAALHDEVIRSTVLNSMKNIYGYKAGTTPVSELVDGGQAQIIGAVRGFVRQEDGKFPLSVYDPKHSDFVPVEALYDEAFRGNNRRTQKAITDRMERELRKDAVGFSLPPKLSVQQGTTSYLEKIEAGLAHRIDQVSRMEPQSRKAAQ